MFNKMDLKQFKYIMLGCLYSTATLADEGPFPLHIIISEDVLHTTNARRSPSEIEEVQSTTTVGLSALIDDYEKVSASMAYQWSQTEYNEDSQAKRPTLTGSANISIGAAADFYTIGLNHTSTELLIDPTESDINSNLENRNTLSASLSLKTRPAKPNQFTFSLTQTHTSFDEFEQNNTDRLKTDVNYSRLISPLNSGGINLSSTEVSYPDFPESDFDTTLLFTYFKRQLKNLDFYIALGLNQSSSIQGDDENPYAQVNFNFTTGVSSFLFSAAREMTDSSQGSNAPTLQAQTVNSNLATSDGSLSVRDQIQRDSLSISYDYSNLCTSCSLRAQVRYEKDEYLNTPSENSTDVLSNIGISYKPTRATNVSLDLRNTAFEFTDAPTADKYDQNSAQISWTWKGKSSLQVSVYAETTERNYEISGSYSINEIGVGLSYQLM